MWLLTPVGIPEVFIHTGITRLIVTRGYNEVSNTRGYNEVIDTRGITRLVPIVLPVGSFCTLLHFCHPFTFHHVELPF